MCNFSTANGMLKYWNGTLPYWNLVISNNLVCICSLTLVKYILDFYKFGCSPAIFPNSSMQSTIKVMVDSSPLANKIRLSVYVKCVILISAHIGWKWKPNRLVTSFNDLENTSRQKLKKEWWKWIPLVKAPTPLEVSINDPIDSH